MNYKSNLNKLSSAGLGDKPPNLGCAKMFMSGSVHITTEIIYSTMVSMTK
jgi:hypothetical protein